MRNKLIILLVILMFVHGALYFYTGDIYSYDNPVKVLKYLLVLFVCAAIFFERLLQPSAATYEIFFIFCWFAILLKLLLNTVYFNLDINDVIFFIFPSLLFLTSKYINIYSIGKILGFVFIFSLLFLGIEFFLLSDVSSRFSSTGFRAISIFINPNAFGIFIVLILSVLNFTNWSKSVLRLFYGLGLLMVVFSGSKTGLGCFVILVILNDVSRILVNKNKFADLFLKYSFFIAIVLVFVMNFQVLDIFESIRLRSLDLESGAQRVFAYREFFQATNNCFFSPRSCNPEVYVDNAFINIWIVLGFDAFLLVLFLMIMSFVITFLVTERQVRYNFFIFYVIFWSAALTTNVISIWPTAYLFWIILGISYANTRGQAKARLSRGYAS